MHEGNPSWGRCEVYQCTEEHKVEYCGLCDVFPCDRLIKYYDPGNPEGPRNAAIRVAVNAYRARHGDSKTLKYFEKTGPLNRPVQRKK